MRRKRQGWVELIGQFKRSGLSTEAYADKRGIPVGRLRWWIWRLRRDERERPSLLPVRVIPSSAPRRDGENVAAMEVELTDGVRVRFIDAAVDTVVEVVSRLRRCCRSRDR